MVGNIQNIALSSYANIAYTYDNLGRLASMAYNSNGIEYKKNTYVIGSDENIASTTVAQNGELYGQ